MTWVRFDDGFPNHRKVAPLDDATYRLHSETIHWCSRNTTDGRIADDELASISTRANKPRAAKLVQRGLWHRSDHDCPSDKCPRGGPDGWVVHDYLDYQPTKEKVRTEQAAKAERQRKWLERRKGDASPDASKDTPKDTPKDESRDASKDAAPSPPRPEGKRGGDLPEAPDDRRDAAASAADGLKPTNGHGPYGAEDPQLIAAEQRTLAEIQAERERENTAAAARASNGASAARAAIRQPRTTRRPA